MQLWRKIGRLVDTSGEPIRRAMLPTLDQLDNGRARLYYGAVDQDMVSRIEFVDIDLSQPTVALSAPVRVLDIGAPGYFDDNGVLPCAIIHQGDETSMLYCGFQKQTKIPYTIFTGLAHSRDGGVSFERSRLTPILERSSTEPFVRTAPCIVATPAGFRLWYVGGGEWIRDGDRVLPTYSLRVMTSAGIAEWPASGETYLTPAGDEIGFGRPWVMAGNGGYQMWYSIRTRAGYRLGYAESVDGYAWRRLDDPLDLGAPVQDFDDQMVCYSFVLRYAASLLMFYNGNGYGRTGIGIARLESGWP
jgi:hypothetical protein